MSFPVREPARAPFTLPEEVKRWFATKPAAQVIPPVFVREWLGEVVRLNYRLLYSIAYGYVHDPGYAEDLVQNALLKGLQNLTRVREPEAILGWLLTVTRNNCLELLRHGYESEPLEEADQLAAPNTIEIYRLDERRLLLVAINKLPEKLADVVRLRFLEENGIPEIAARLGLRRNTVDVRLHRALECLAKDPSLKDLKEYIDEAT
jgi:RNA polymerase sigma-70 factor (ECF subfamily)